MSNKNKEPLTPEEEGVFPESQREFLAVIGDDYLAPVLSTEYWDCECTVDYIHSKRYSECLRCNSIAEEQPDSHLREVIKLKKEFK